jgi:hypothetical protein
MPVSNKALPNFFIVGAPKAGTTSLYQYLNQHPDVYMSPIKEPNYFASEIRPDNVSEEFEEQVRRDMVALKAYLQGPMSESRFGGMVLEWEDYLKLFESVKQEIAIGEASVLYLWSKTAPVNIVSRIPEAKIVMILRDPAERAFSQYLHNVANGVTCESFRQHIYTSSRWNGEKFNVACPSLELGLYYEQVKRYLKLFPRENIYIAFFEDYQQQPARMLEELFRFLNIDSRFTPDMSEKQLEPKIPRAFVVTHFLKRCGVWQHFKKLSPPMFQSRLRTIVFKKRRSLVMDARDRDYLLAYYRDDIRKLSNLLDRDLSRWLT